MDYHFENMQNEILSLFGFYKKIEKMLSVKVISEKEFTNK